jgi:hypothetical protein
MIPKKPVPDLIRDGVRFSEKIMRKQMFLADFAVLKRRRML